jgi:hypothetical protein
MQKIQLKYVKILFIGLFLAISAIFITRIITPSPSSCVSVASPSSVPPCSTEINFVELPINLYPQQSINWCWAASIQMCIKTIKNDSISQCQIVTDRVNLTSPTTSPYTACDCPKSKDGCSYPLIDNQCHLFSRSLPADVCKEQNIIKSILEKYDLTTQIIDINTTNTANQVKNNLCSGNPIIAILRGPSSHHIVVIKGFQTIDTNSSFLLVNNPLNERIPTCKGCYHVIPINEYGKSIMSFLGSATGGTYNPLMFFAVIPKPK